MSHQISVTPSGHKFVAEADETILEAALRQGLRLLSAQRNHALQRRQEMRDVIAGAGLGPGALRD